MFPERSVRITAWIVCCLFVLFTVTPFLWILATAFKTPPGVVGWSPARTW